MKFSLWTSNSRPWSEMLDLATYAEATGWHSLWYADHFMSQTADDTPGDGDALECWSVLAAVAAAVPRLRLTSMVSPVTIHHPVVLAKRAATVDQISGGRVVLGLGAGWQVNEHAGYGFRLPAPAERVTHFIEALQVIRHLLDDARASFAGQWYTLTDAPFEPKPVQSPLPILVGTSGQRMMRATARYATEWNTWGDPTTVAAKTAEFETACAAVDADFAAIRRSAQALLFFADDAATADKVRAAAPAGRSLIGSSAEIVDLVGAYADGGVDELALPDFNLGASAAQRREAIERFRDEVAAHFI
ncbi:MAG: class flavin-dependent oxidoreductase [Ilumatobacteraceae bacterium]|nr:class flavin-dependent oxidoreductase [Ilumatobacteraceae bacterium]